jgi:ParB-like chromosome segregation protein Spo0J
MADRMALADLLANYRPGSYDPPWTWNDERRDLLAREPDFLHGLRADIAANGIREPVQLHHGERRVWDGHHRIVVAIDLGLPAVPVVDARYSDTDRTVATRARP